MSGDEGSFRHETALSWFMRLGHPSLVFRTGHEQFDAFCAVMPADLVEIVGRDATGKLQLALTLVAELLLSESKAHHRVVVLDFNGSFRIERLKQILVSREPRLMGENEAIVGHLDNIYYSRVFCSEELEKCLVELKRVLESIRFIPFIVVNKIGAILFDILDDNNFDGSHQKRILGTLKELCVSHGATVVTTNHLVDWRGYPAPALGNAWIKGIGQRIFLHRDSDGERAQFSAQILGEKVRSGKLRYALTNRGDLMGAKSAFVPYSDCTGAGTASTSVVVESEGPSSAPMVDDAAGLEEIPLQEALQGQQLGTEESVAFLSHSETLVRILGRLGEQNVLNNWTEEDCAGLLIQLLKHSCDEEGAKRIVRCFRDTSVDEILDCFNLCKDMNTRVARERAQLNDFPAAPSTVSGPSVAQTHPNWSSLVAQVKRSRGIGDDSVSAIATLLAEMSSKCEDEVAAFDSPDYKLIYDHLGSLVRGYTMKGVRSIDAAVMLEIFESMERVADSLPQLLSFFNQMFKDVQHFVKDEFKIGEELDEENVGKMLTNVLELPDEFFDLSSMFRNTSDK
uniref:DNA recombination and repair protein Rad51-like C-terminal domain-containing protein n=1 Tax=Globodera rostochiensis TaxID=31243 RepID=A0A914H9Z1_GLORO